MSPAVRVLATACLAVAGYALGVRIEQRHAENHLTQVERWRAQVAERECRLACCQAFEDGYDAGQRDQHLLDRTDLDYLAATANPSMN